MTNPTKDPKAAADEVKQRKLASFQWLKNGYYDQWISSFKSYKCERDPEKDPNDSGKTDVSQTSIGMPDTWALVRRQVARITSQQPNLRFRAKDQDLADRISRKLMYDWDRGGVQRVQKKHVTQACLFGWSVRPWAWDCLEYPRSKRIDPLEADIDDQTKGLIDDQYGDQMKQIHQDKGPGFEPGTPANTAELMADHSRGGLLPVKYSYKKYEGPKTDFLFIGDCFPEPNFQSLQGSNWFIVRRRRNRSWLKRIAAAFKKQVPDIEKNIQDMLDGHPKGTPNNYFTKEENFLRVGMMGAIEQVDDSNNTFSEQAANWTITECHVPGENASLTLVGEDNYFICEIPYPYDLDGKIAFTELVLIDDIIAGIGDSHARIIRGLQLLHDRQVNVRHDVVNTILRPLVWTTNQQLYDNPELLKRGPGFRLVQTNGPNEIGVLGEQAALAAVAVGLQDEQAIQRNLQMATGESNMSMASNVDPQQTRTATGARLLAYNMDILSKDMNDMFTTTSLNADAEMMYLLNRSEMPEAVTFDAAPYNRNYGSSAGGSSPQQQQPPAPPIPPVPGDTTDPGAIVPPQPTSSYMTVSPHDFQVDGEIEAEAGSTLADDDDAKVSKVQSLFAAAVSHPNLFNMQTAAKEYLIVMGKGRDLDQWIAPPPPPPPPPPPSEPMRESMTISVKFETLDPAVQAEIMAKAGIAAPPPPGGPMGGPMPGGPGPGPVPSGPPLGPMPRGGPPLPPPPPHDVAPIGPAVLAAEGKR